MKRIVCEMCGSNDLIKKDGLFVCENCGTKYTLEEAKKMMVEGTVQVEINTSKSDANLLEVIKTACATGNSKEVFELASRLVENNPSNWEGWFYKGVGAYKESAIDKCRLSEALALFFKAYSVAGEDKKEEVEKIICKETLDAIKYLRQLFCLALLADSGADVSESAIDYLSDAVSAVADLYDECSIDDVATHECICGVSQEFFDTLKAAVRRANADFGTHYSVMTDEKWEKWLDQVDGVLDILEYLILYFPALSKSIPVYLDYFNKLNNITIDSCSYVFDGDSYSEHMFLTNEAKKMRRQRYDNLRKQRDERIADNKALEEEVQQCKNDLYWKEHEDEKKSLLAQIDDLKEQQKPYNEQIIQIDNEIKEVKAANKNPINEEKVASIIEEKIEAVKKELKSYGLLDFKGRKPLKLQLKQLNSELKEANKLARNARYEANMEMNKKVNDLVRQKNRVLDKIADLTKKINGVNNELNRDR